MIRPVTYEIRDEYGDLIDETDDLWDAMFSTARLAYGGRLEAFDGGDNFLTWQIDDGD